MIRPGRKISDMWKSSFILLFLLVGCAGTLTEEQLELREYEETQRRLSYIEWEQSCKDQGGKVFSINPVKPCMRGYCIPTKADWKTGKKTNNTICKR